MLLICVSLISIIPSKGLQSHLSICSFLCSALKPTNFLSAYMPITALLGLKKIEFYNPLELIKSVTYFELEFEAEENVPSPHSCPCKNKNMASSPHLNGSHTDLGSGPHTFEKEIQSVLTTPTSAMRDS